ncbi:MAG: hypothetical protein CFE41_16055 [Burkholderiales bacterium PBB2]|nr:MAG: hypothetical protein CFE41_16055 [Burkholderiales bacterium PBB2]
MRAQVPVTLLARAPYEQVLLNSRDSLRDLARLELLDKTTRDESDVVLLREKDPKRLHRYGRLSCV